MTKMRHHAAWALVAAVLLGTGITAADAHVSFSFGFGFGGWAPYGPYPPYGFGLGYTYSPSPTYMQSPPHDVSPVVLDISPKKATLLIDGEDVGKARDYDSKAYPLLLKKGTHVLELRYKGYRTLRVKFTVRPGKAYRVHYDLHAGEGIDPRSTSAQTRPTSAGAPRHTSA
jgi:PEGA domain-containing protein